MFLGQALAMSKVMSFSETFILFLTLFSRDYVSVRSVCFDLGSPHSNECFHKITR